MGSNPAGWMAFFLLLSHPTFLSPVECPQSGPSSRCISICVLGKEKAKLCCLGQNGSVKLWLSKKTLVQLVLCFILQSIAPVPWISKSTENRTRDDCVRSAYATTDRHSYSAWPIQSKWLDFPAKLSKPKERSLWGQATCRKNPFLLILKDRFN